MDTWAQQFKSRVDAFLESTGISPTTFGLRAVGDPHLMRELARGRSPTLRTVDRILAYIAAFELDGGGARAPPPPVRGRRSSSRARRTRSSRAMTEQRMEQRGNRPIRFLRMPEVVYRTGLARSTIKERVREGSFPKPVSLGARARGWIEAEIEEWMRERIAESRGDAEAVAY